MVDPSTGLSESVVRTRDFSSVSLMDGSHHDQCSTRYHSSPARVSVQDTSSEDPSLVVAASESVVCQDGSYHVTFWYITVSLRHGGDPYPVLWLDAD